MTHWLLDAGNTRIKLARVTSPATCEYVGVLDYPALAEWVAARNSDDQYSVACVAAPERHALLRQSLPATSLQWAVTPAHGLGIRCAYADHRKWGVDRWLALAAAHAQEKAAVAVIDVGTATTVDLCDAHGLHLGGWIAPGPQPLMQALRQHTALPPPAASLPETLGLATDTETGILLGALQCAVGGIHQALRVAAAQQVQQVFLTGGGADLLAGYLRDVPLRLQPHLVLNGLARLAAC